MSEPSTLASEVIARLLDETGWTRRELATKMNVGYQSLGKWQHGQANPHVTRLAIALISAGFDPADYGVHSPLIDDLKPAAQSPSHSDDVERAIATLDKVYDQVQLLPEMMRLMSQRIEHLEKALLERCDDDK